MSLHKIEDQGYFPFPYNVDIDDNGSHTQIYLQCFYNCIGNRETISCRKMQVVFIHYLSSNEWIGHLVVKSSDCCVMCVLYQYVFLRWSPKIWNCARIFIIFLFVWLVTRFIGHKSVFGTLINLNINVLKCIQKEDSNVIYNAYYMYSIALPSWFWIDCTVQCSHWIMIYCVPWQSWVRIFHQAIEYICMFIYNLGSYR